MKPLTLSRVVPPKLAVGAFFALGWRTGLAHSRGLRRPRTEMVLPASERRPAAGAPTDV
jgi:hypothetical protein